MGRTCDIAGCTNSNYKTEKMSYHSLPSDKILRGKWLDAVNANGGFRQSKTRKKTHNCDNTYICGEHFSDDCYISTSKQKHLKPTAVPTFPPLKKRHKANNNSDYATGDYFHEIDDSPFQMTPESSSRENSTTHSSQASNSRKAAETSSKNKSPDTMLTNVDKYGDNMTISTINYSKETVFIIEKCTSSQTQSIAGNVEHLERDIDNGFRTLEIFEINLQKISKNKQEFELEKTLTDLMKRKEEAKRQLVQRREEKLTKEVAWTEEQESVFELQQNLLNDDKNAEHLGEVEKILAQREEEIKQLRIQTSDEIFDLEERVKDLDRRISEFQDSRSTKLEELLNQESTLLIRKKDLIEDLKQKVYTVKVLKTKLVESKAEERLSKLDQFVGSHGESN